MMAMACPVTEVVVRVPATGSNRVKSALPIAFLPVLNASAPTAFTCTVTVSDVPVHGTPGKLLTNDPEPCVSLWPLTWITLASPNATFNVGSHVNVSGTETDAPSGPSRTWPIDSCVETAAFVPGCADAGDDARASAPSAIGTTRAKRNSRMIPFLVLG